MPSPRSSTRAAGPNAGPKAAHDARNAAGKGGRGHGQKAPEAAACPKCQAPIAVHGERGTCASCGLPVRFVDAPERPCTGCAAALALPPGIDAVRCPACGLLQSADPARPLVARARCPRCRRMVDVGSAAERASCPHCGTGMILADTL